MSIPDEYLTVPEVAHQLRVDPATVRRWIKAGDLPAVKFGRDYRVPEAELAQMIAMRRTVPLTAARAVGQVITR